MAHITVYAAIANAASKLPNGKERTMMDRVLDRMSAESEVFNPSGRSFGLQMMEVEESGTSQIGHICPHCKREPMQIAVHIIQFGTAPGAVFSCSGCRKVISCAPLPMVPDDGRIRRDPNPLIVGVDI
jgi:hypothetical protein